MKHDSSKMHLTTFISDSFVTVTKDLMTIHTSFSNTLWEKALTIEILKTLRIPNKYISLINVNEVLSNLKIQVRQDALK